MHRQVSVSVIIPTFNRLSLLYPTIVCLLNQRCDEKNISFEIIIIDSGSDETETVIQHLDAQKPGFLVYRKIDTSRNRSFLRNAGAKLSSGEILIFLDNDMLVPPDFIQTHYRAHSEKENLVVLGKRKSLTEFNPNKMGIDLLVSDFSLLESMPYYYDVRDPLLADKNVSVGDSPCPWRFLYSHNFSLRKTLFDRTNHFNVDFGEHWGYEDVELGFQLFMVGAIFSMENTLSVYHQPHFEQSRQEQSLASLNRLLFLKLHPCFEVELFLSFFEAFDRHYEKMLPVRETDLHYVSNYPVVSGRLFDVNDIKDHERYKNCWLGTFLPFYADNSVPKILILQTFYGFAEEIQLAILYESFRVAEEVDIQKNKAYDTAMLERLSCIIGYVISLQEKELVFRITVVQKKISRVFNIILPDIFSPGKRFFYLKLAHELIVSGAKIILEDVKETKDFENEDYTPGNEERAILKSCIRNYFGSCKARSIASGSLLHIGHSITAMPHHERLWKRECKNVGIEAVQVI
jgi:glycosyltransferase involved in cell wall biosynthesis